MGCGGVLGKALLADVIDLDERRTGERKEGVYSAASTSSLKAEPRRVAASGPVMTATGFVPNVEQSEESLLGIRILFAGLPCAGFLSAPGCSAASRSTKRAAHRPRDRGLQGTRSDVIVPGPAGARLFGHTLPGSARSDREAARVRGAGRLRADRAPAGAREERGGRGRSRALAVRAARREAAAARGSRPPSPSRWPPRRSGAAVERALAELAPLREPGSRRRRSRAGSARSRASGRSAPSSSRSAGCGGMADPVPPAEPL